MKNNVTSNYCNTCDRVIDPEDADFSELSGGCPECGMKLPNYLAHLGRLGVVKPVVPRTRKVGMPVAYDPANAEGGLYKVVKGYSGPSLEQSDGAIPGTGAPPPPYTFNDYQRASAKTAVYPGQGTNAGISYLIHGLTGEAGEVANKFKKVLRDDSGFLTEASIAAIREEMGDVLWYLQQLDTELSQIFSADHQSSFETIALKNRVKLMLRAAKGTLKGEGDNR